jgi:hypothetical protein
LRPRPGLLDEVQHRVVALGESLPDLALRSFLRVGRVAAEALAETHHAFGIGGREQWIEQL